MTDALSAVKLVLQTMNHYYSCRLLHSLRRGAGYPPPGAINLLKTQNLFRNRGARAGRCTQRPIKIITSARDGYFKQEKKPYKHFEVPRLWYELPTVLMSNVTSLNNKLDEVITSVLSIKADVVAITEPWQVSSELCNIEGFSVFSHLRQARRGGGVLLWCRDTLRPSVLNVQVPEGVEALWVRTAPARHPRQVASIIFCVAYHPLRSPSGPVLINHLIDSVDSLRARYTSAKFVICGDFKELDPIVLLTNC